MELPSQQNQKFVLKAWDSICLPKDLGGLGIRKMREVNLALISKLGWKLLCKVDMMWVSQLRGKYLFSNSFLSPSLSSSSCPWKGILKSHSIISKGAYFKIHNKSSLPVWSSPWIPSIPLFIPSSSPLLNHPLLDLLVSDLFLFDHISPLPSWKSPRLSQLFDPHYAREIKKIRIPLHSFEVYLWTPCLSSLFTTKLAYNLISKPRTSTAISPISPSHWKAMWKLRLTDRLKIFLWKIAWDIIPSKTRINDVFPLSPADLIYPLCNVEEDSLHHLFFRCPFGRISWRTSHWPLDSLKWFTISFPN